MARLAFQKSKDGSIGEHPAPNFMLLPMISLSERRFPFPETEHEFYRHCYDNALMESFFHTLKTELIYFEKYRTRQEAQGSVFEYIEIFYNRTRRHSSLNYCSPAEFEKRASEASPGVHFFG